MKKLLSILLTATVLLMTLTIFASCGDTGTAGSATTNATTDANATSAAVTDAPATEAVAVTEAPATEAPTDDPALAPEAGKAKVTKWYPASSLSEGIAAPATGTLLTGDLIGSAEGWGGNVDTGYDAAFDGDTTTFFDPTAASDPTTYCGLKTDKAYVLTEIRICPRSDFLDRFNGASIWGTNDDVFDPATATQIWVSDAAADEAVFQVITADKFIAGANTGFTHFIYFNQANHGDVAEIELYGTAK